MTASIAYSIVPAMKPVTFISEAACDRSPTHSLTDDTVLL